jgi:hypothetical protein
VVDDFIRVLLNENHIKIQAKNEVDDKSFTLTSARERLNALKTFLKDAHHNLVVIKFKETQQGTLIPRALKLSRDTFHPRNFYRVVVIFHARNQVGFHRLFFDWYTGTKENRDLFMCEGSYLFPVLFAGGSKDQPCGKLARSVLSFYIEYLRCLPESPFSFVPWMQIFEINSTKQLSQLIFTVDVPYTLIEGIVMGIHNLIQLHYY